MLDTPWAFVGVNEQHQKMLDMVRSWLKDHRFSWLLIEHVIEFWRLKDLRVARGRVLEILAHHVRRTRLSHRSQRQDCDTASEFCTHHLAMISALGRIIGCSSNWNFGTCVILE
jgi:hypothetical protein